MTYADQDFKQYKVAVELLKQRIEVEKLLHYEISSQMDFFMDYEKNLLGGFFRDWERGNYGNTWYINESKKQIEKGFDIMINTIEE